jgi:hypothetical protein
MEFLVNAWTRSLVHHDRGKVVWAGVKTEIWQWTTATQDGALEYFHGKDGNKREDMMGAMASPTESQLHNTTTVRNSDDMGKCDQTTVTAHWPRHCRSIHQRRRKRNHPSII